MAEYKIALAPVGPTTQREVAALQTELQDALSRVRGVERVSTVSEAAPPGAKGLGFELGAMALTLPPGVITGVFDMIKAVLSRPAQPQTEVEISATGVKLKFDPKTVSLEDMASFVKTLQSAPS